MRAYVKAAEAVSSVDASYGCVFELLESAAVSLDRMVGAAEGSSCQILITSPPHPTRSSKANSIRSSSEM